jgi:hypothetical protein
MHACPAINRIHIRIFHIYLVNTGLLGSEPPVHIQIFPYIWATWVPSEENLRFFGLPEGFVRTGCGREKEGTGGSRKALGVWKKRL